MNQMDTHLNKMNHEYMNESNGKSHKQNESIGHSFEKNES